MTLGALSWPVLLAIVGVASVIVIGLHLLRLRRRKVVVPHLAIFEEAIGSAATAKRVDWIRRILALLLSLLIAGALSLSLGEPELPRNDKGEIRILVIDQSLSMEARDETGRSRRDRALEEAARWIESKDENDSMAILAADHMPLILSPLSKDRDALKSSLRQSTKGWGEAALRETLMLGRDLIEEAQRRAPAPHQALEMVVLTDEPMEEIVEEVFGNTAMQESAENSSNETDEAGLCSSGSYRSSSQAGAITLPSPSSPRDVFQAIPRASAPSRTSKTMAPPIERRVSNCPPRAARSNRWKFAFLRIRATFFL